MDGQNNAGATGMDAGGVAPISTGSAPEKIATGGEAKVDAGATAIDAAKAGGEATDVAKPIWEGEVNGKKISITNDKDLKRLITLSQGAMTAQRKAAEIERELEAERGRKFSSAKEAREFLRDRGVNVKELAEEEFVEAFRRSQMTPEQLADEEASLKNNDEYVKAAEENKRLKQKLTDIEYDRFSQIIHDGMRARGLPMKGIYAGMIAREIRMHQEAGVEYDMDSIFDRVAQEYKSSLSLGISDDAKLEDLQGRLGDDYEKIEKIIRAKIEAEKTHEPKGWAANGHEAGSGGTGKKVSLREMQSMSSMMRGA